MRFWTLQPKNLIMPRVTLKTTLNFWKVIQKKTSSSFQNTKKNSSNSANKKNPLKS